MHPQVLALLDDCVDQLAQLRDELRERRQVEPGERYQTTLQAAEIARRFAANVTRLVSDPSPALTPAKVRTLTEPGLPGRAGDIVPIEQAAEKARRNREIPYRLAGPDARTSATAS